MIKVIYILIAVAIVAGIFGVLLSTKSNAPVKEESIACTQDAMMCSDGSYVGRTGPNCEFVCPITNEPAKDDQVKVDDKSNFIKLASPVANSVISSPLVISGEARGGWYFEGSFPVVLTNWDGLIIAEGFATADGDWMTEDFVPFTANLDFVSPYKTGEPDFMKSATLILKKDNPSGLPENDDVLEIPVKFAP